MSRPYPPSPMPENPLRWRGSHQRAIQEPIPSRPSPHPSSLDTSLPANPSRRPQSSPLCVKIEKLRRNPIPGRLLCGSQSNRRYQPVACEQQATPIGEILSDNEVPGGRLERFEVNLSSYSSNFPLLSLSLSQLDFPSSTPCTSLSESRVEGRQAADLRSPPSPYLSCSGDSKLPQPASVFHSSSNCDRSGGASRQAAAR